MCVFIVSPELCLLSVLVVLKLLHHLSSVHSHGGGGGGGGEVHTHTHTAIMSAPIYVCVCSIPGLH